VGDGATATVNVTVLPSATVEPGAGSIAITVPAGTELFGWSVIDVLSPSWLSVAWASATATLRRSGRTTVAALGLAEGVGLGVGEGVGLGVGDALGDELATGAGLPLLWKAT
jgi:hypothetical protein